MASALSGPLVLCLGVSCPWRFVPSLPNYIDHHETLKTMTAPTSDPTRDYRWRLSISREEWLILATRLADAVNYPNFKIGLSQATGSRLEA